MHDQIVVSIQDLQFVTITCDRCNTRVTFDLATEFERPRDPFQPPQECPRCHAAFDSAIPPAVSSMQKVFKALANLKAVTFTAGQPGK